MTDTRSAVIDLRSRWHTLCDLDRARAVQSLNRDGMTLRAIASQLNCSQSLLSHLVRATQAPVEDRELARCGEISTRELARRAGSSGTRPTSTQREAVAFDRERAATQASQIITRWLDFEKVANTDRDRVINHAQSHLLNADKSVVSPLGAHLPDIPIDEVIRLFRPVHLETDGDRSVAWFAEWLAQWTLYGIFDDGVRARALELAWSLNVTSKASNSGKT